MDLYFILCLLLSTSFPTVLCSHASLILPNILYDATCHLSLCVLLICDLGGNVPRTSFTYRDVFRQWVGERLMSFFV